MKLNLAFSFLFASVAVAQDHTTCTFGKLFVSDNATSTIRVFDVANGQTSGLTAEHSITVKGGPEVFLDYAHNGAVAAIYRGSKFGHL